jgi:hypothetical protein
LSSLLGLAVAIAVAHTVSARAFGAFAVALATYYIVLGISRAVSSEPFVVRFSAAAREEFRREAARGSGSAVVVAVSGSGSCIAAASLVTGSLRSCLLGLALALPGLLTQDFLRFAAFSQQRGAIALASDGLWAIGVGIAMSAALASGTKTAGWLVLAWGLPALAGALLSSVRLRVVPNPLAAMSWWSGQRDLAPRYLGEFMASSGAAQVSIYLVGAIAGLTATAALRGAQVLLGPLNVLFMGVGLVAIPEAVGLARRARGDLLRFSRALSAVLTGAALVWGAIVVFLPDVVGRSLLGPTWDQASSVAPIVALMMAGSGAVAGAFVGLRAFAAAKRSLRVRLMLAPLIVLTATGGAFADGARGAAIGLAVTAWVGVWLWWRQYLAELVVGGETDGRRVRSHRLILRGY